MKPEAITKRVRESPDDQLGLRILTTDGRHVAAALLAGVHVTHGDTTYQPISMIRNTVRIRRMECLHPHCPLSRAQHPPDWAAALAALKERGVFRRASDVDEFLQIVPQLGPLAPGKAAAPMAWTGRATLWKRLREACTCLCTQIDADPSANVIVHLCEITINQPLTAANVEQAFRMQHPPQFRFAPARGYANAGAVSQAFCRAVLISAGLQELLPARDGWPAWATPGFINLNQGRTAGLSSFGDFLIPAAPTNILISCKTWAARERLLNSGIRVDTVGFGFFQSPKEFWTRMRMNTLRRFGFTAIYMPAATYDAIMERLRGKDLVHQAINVNARPLYRKLSEFGTDMFQVSGRLSLEL